MGELASLRNALKTRMAAVLSTRVVTRDFKDFADRDESELQSGIVSIIGAGEKGYANYLGRATQLGTLPMLVVGQIQIAEGSAPSAVEDAEDLLAEEIKAFCRDPGSDLLGGITMTGFRQSGQTDAPYGWIAIELEVMT